MIETKRKSLILNIVLSAIILIIGVLFWPSKDKFNQSNPKDSNKTQIKVIVKALNIRKEATTESEDIGTVYYDEIFTVISHIEKSDYYWYRIKTKQGLVGYIASDKETPYVKLISGYIDRTPPKIIAEENPLIFINGEKDYNKVKCEDEYTTCTMTHEEKEDGYITFKAVDKDNNESTLNVQYYNVYKIKNSYSDNDEDLKVNIKNNKNGELISFSTEYVTKKTIFNENLSKNYIPFIEFYDEELHILDDIFIKINDEELSDECINTEDNKLKDIYSKKDIIKDNKLCFNFTYNEDEEIKYIRFGFNGVENSLEEDNYLKGYTSKYFIIDTE